VMVDIERFQKRDTGIRNFMSNIKIAHIILFGFILLVIILIGNNKTIDPKYNWLMYGVLIAIIIYLYFKPNPDNRKLITREEAAEIAQEELNKMVRRGDNFSPDSKVYVTDSCSLCSFDNLAQGKSDYSHWEVGFVEKVKGSNFDKDGVIKIHAYDGIVTGVKKAPLGYDGTQSIDRVKTIPVAVFQGSIDSTEVGKSGDVKR